MLFCNRCSKTCVEAKLPFGQGSCEIKVWRFCLNFNLWIGGQISKSWTYVNIGCDLSELLGYKLEFIGCWEWFILMLDGDQGWLLQPTKSGKGWDVSECFAWSIWIGFVMFVCKNDHGYKQWIGVETGVG